MLTFITLYHSSSGRSQNGAMVICENKAELLISMSIFPIFFKVLFTISETDEFEDTSVSKKCCPP